MNGNRLMLLLLLAVLGLHSAEAWRSRRGVQLAFGAVPVSIIQDTSMDTREIVPPATTNTLGSEATSDGYNKDEQHAMRVAAECSDSFLAADVGGFFF